MCKKIIHHGGAGTVGIALSIPELEQEIIPLHGEHLYWQQALSSTEQVLEPTPKEAMKSLIKILITETNK